MGRIIAYLAVLLLVIPKMSQSAPCKEVIAYYCDWLAGKLPPNQIDYSKYTIINFAFFQPMTDGSIQEGDAGVDPQLINDLVAAAHQHGVKVMLSVGGWTWSDNFPAIAANTQTRSKFADECLRLINHYKLDGIDIDWEYPGYDEHNGTSADKANYTLFMTGIRNAIGSNALLSGCFGSSQERMDNIEWNDIVPVLDMINLMTYDFFGSWDNTTNHNSPLYSPAQGDPLFNVNAAFQSLVNNYHVPSTKINLGAPFYGHSFAGATTLFGTSTGPDKQNFPNDDGDPTYTEVLAKKNLYTEYWDSNAKVPYLIGNNGLQSFVSYDNEQSINLKGKYIADNNARGAIIWEISGDYVSNIPVLATALVNGLCGNNTNIQEGVKQGVIFYPNPTNGIISVIVTNGNHNNISVYNEFGKTILSENFNEQEFTINLQGYERGLYFVRIVNDNGIICKNIEKK